jgi:uncharacterized membrane protein
MRRRGERGATAPLIALLITIFIVCSALAVDIGMQRVARADAQSLADIVALDLARELNGRTVNQLKSAGIQTTLANQSRDRNTSVVGSDDHVPELVVQLGEFTDGEFVDHTGDGAYVPTAVRVAAKTEVGFVFGGITGVASGDANREAVATADKGACFRLGSFVASLDTKQSALLNPILSALFGSSINLTAVGYQGLADANVSLLDLVEVGNLGVGSVDELLALDHVSVATLFVAAAKVLDQQGNAVQADLLRQLALKVGTPTIDIADLIEASGTSQAALDAELNVLDLVTGAAFVANDDHAVELKDLGVALPPPFGQLAKVNLTVIEPPRTKCGPVGTTNETAQVRLDAEVTLPATQLALLGSSVSLDQTKITISFDVGKAIAELQDVLCPTGKPDKLKLALRSALIGSLAVNASLGVHGRIDPVGGLLNSILGLLNLGSLVKPPYLTLDTSLSLYAGFPAAASYDKTIELPIPGSYSTPVGSGTGNLVPSLSVTPAAGTDVVLHYWDGLLLLGSWKERHLTSPLNSVFDGVVTPLVSTVMSSLLNPLVSTLQQNLLLPLAELLGVQLAGADVFAVPTPTCGLPRLVD